MAITYVEADPGAAGAKLATDQIVGVDYPISKIDNGAAGAAGGPVSAGNPLPVVLETGTDSIGEVTANAGANLNTSALSLESGGNLDSIAAATAANAISNASIDGKITKSNTDNVTVSTSALPIGAATAAKQLADGHNVAINAPIPVGANAIGKLAANSGVDIGDVDVTSLANGSINGPGEPSIDSLSHAAIVSKIGTDQVLISAPGANKQIWVYGIQFTMSTAGTVAFQDEDDTALTGPMGIADTGGMSVAPAGNFAMPLWKLPTNKALEADIVTGTINGSITYAIVSV